MSVTVLGPPATAGAGPGLRAKSLELLVYLAAHDGQAHRDAIIEDLLPDAPASGRFRILVRTSDLPPIRLHDLRHGAASLAHEASADLLGHSSIVITADTPPTLARVSWPSVKVA